MIEYFKNVFQIISTQIDHEGKKMLLLFMINLNKPLSLKSNTQTQKFFYLFLCMSQFLSLSILFQMLFQFLSILVFLQIFQVSAFSSSFLFKIFLWIVFFQSCKVFFLMLCTWLSSFMLFYIMR